MVILSSRSVLISFWWIFSFIALTINNANPVLAGIPVIPAPTISPQPTNVSKAEFGVKLVDLQGKVDFFPTNNVPFKVGNTYGWRIQLENYHGEVKWREVFHLPKPPETWATEHSEDFDISKDGTTAISNRTQTTANGVIENFWQIAPGDPIGVHKIEVYIDQRQIATFNFEIIAIK
jgi:hypothetical protein